MVVLVHQTRIIHLVFDEKHEFEERMTQKQMKINSRKPPCPVESCNSKNEGKELA